MAIYRTKLVREVLNDAPTPKIMQAKHVVDYVMQHCYKIEEMEQEYAYMIFLDRQNRVTGHHLLSMGTDSATGFDKRLVCRLSLMANAISVVLVHNHPSGNPMPSLADIRATNDAKNGLNTIGIQLLDHVIIGDDMYYSFTDEVKGKIL